MKRQLKGVSSLEKDIKDSKTEEYTKENMTKEQTIEQKADDYIKQYLPHVNTLGHWLGFQDGYKQALSESSGSVAAPKEEPKEKGESDEFYKLHLFEYSYSDKKELPISLLRKMHEAMFYWVMDSHPNQKYKTEYYDLSVRATQVALSELASLRQQLAEQVELRDLLDRAYWYMKSNPPDKTKMSYNEWEDIMDRAKALLDKK